MTQRITSQMQSSNVLMNLNNDLSALDNTQQQISTGLSINQPSDDPDGTALAMQLSGQIAAMNGYTANVNDATRMEQHRQRRAAEHPADGPDAPERWSSRAATAP